MFIAVGVVMPLGLLLLLIVGVGIVYRCKKGE